MLPSIRRIIDLSKNNFRCIHSTYTLYEETVEYDKGVVKIKETGFPRNKIEEMMDRIHIDRWDSSLASVKSYGKAFYRRQEVKDQIYNPNRVKVLGADLAAATFLVYRGGVVKFVGHDQLFSYKNKHLLPVVKDDSFLVEAVDLSGMNIYYEGLDHFKELSYLRSISFRGSQLFNNWFLDRISHLVPTIEYLDIGYCKNVDHNGLYCVYRMKNLKCLNLEGILDTPEFRLTALTLESERRDLVVLGTLNKPKPKSAFEIN